jgi:uncharacterized protein YigA (DUF484 family)
MTAAQDEPTRLTDKDVISYLRLDPDFFQRHSKLLSELNLPHDTGGAVSLIERQVAILRERNMAMRRRMNELVQAAKANETLFEKTRSLTLELLHVDTWHALNEVLATYVLVDFQADFVCCHLRNSEIRMDHVRGHGEELPNERYSRSIDPACVTLRADELEVLFPAENHDEDGSAVLAPLVLNEAIGCLAIGSRDPAHFESDMDTLFVAYIAEVVARVVQRLSP